MRVTIELIKEMVEKALKEADISPRKPEPLRKTASTHVSGENDASPPPTETIDSLQKRIEKVEQEKRMFYAAHDTPSKRSTPEAKSKLEAIKKKLQSLIDKQNKLRYNKD